MRITTTGALIAIQTTATTTIIGEDGNFDEEDFLELIDVLGLKGVELDSKQWDYCERGSWIVWVIDGMSDPHGRVNP